LIAEGGGRVPGGEVVRQRLAELVSQLAAAAALIVICVYLTFASPYFLTPTNLVNVVVQAAVTAVIATGMTMVIITAGIDLSVGSVAALAGVLGARLMVQAHVPWPLAVLAGSAVGLGCGLGNGLLVTRVGLAPFIATLGMTSVARGLTYIATGAVAVYGVPQAFRVLGGGNLGPVPVPFVALVGVALAAHLILSWTRLGRYAYAIGSNREAARLAGIPVDRFLVMVYCLQGLLAGFGGMIAASRTNSGQPNFGIGLELDVIAAAVIGGASLFGGQGTILGTLLGAFLIELIRNGSVLLNVDVYAQSVIIGVIIWLAVAWDQFRRRRLTQRRRVGGAE
jgi:ribose transport system permease protein